MGWMGVQLQILHCCLGQLYLFADTATLHTYCLGCKTAFVVSSEAWQPGLLCCSKLNAGSIFKVNFWTLKPCIGHRIQTTMKKPCVQFVGLCQRLFNLSIWPMLQIALNALNDTILSSHIFAFTLRH